MNNIIMIGRLTKDPELRFIPGSGKAVCKFDIAVDKRFKTDSGPKADFFNCQCWGKSAEAVAQYTLKGSLVAVSGELQNNNYEDKNGVKHYGVVINAEQVKFLNRKKDGAGGNAHVDDFQEIEDDDDIPF